MTNQTWDSLAQAETITQPELLTSLVQEADAVVVGIGAGMSAADGFTYIGPRFTQNFPDFIEKYGFFDMLQASLHHFDSWQEYWAFESRFVALNYLDQPVGPSYLALKEMLSHKAHHIITTNADNAFAVADYDLNNVFHIQGEYILWQCSQHCHQQTYRDDAAIRRMVAEQSNMEVPRELVPRCPKCDAPMEINKRKAAVGMVEDADFQAQLARYNAFIEAHQTDKVLYLEIGIGYTTPQFVKHPFQRRTAQNAQALYVTMNHKAYRIPEKIRAQSLHLSEDIATVIQTANQKLTH